MWRVTGKAILADRRVIPEKRPPFLGMAVIARIVDRHIREHLVCPATMRIMARGTTDLDIALFGAKQVSGSLEEILSPISMAFETGLFNRLCRQQVFRQLGANNLLDLG